MERSRLLLGWLAARRAVDHCLSDLLAAGPAGERRVRESLARVDDLETRAQVAFDRYRSAAGSAEAAGPGAGHAHRWVTGPSTPGPDAPEDGQSGRATGDPARNDRGTTADRGVTAAPGGDPRPFEADRRNVMPLHVNPRSMTPAGREQAGPDPGAGDRWAPRERPRLNVVRESDLARSSTNTKSNQRHR